MTPTCNTAKQRPSHPQFPTTPVSLTEHPATLPRAEIPANTDLADVVTRGLKYLSNLSTEHLTENVIWRDSLALTGTLRTFFGPRLVSNVWSKLGKKHSPGNFQIVPGSAQITTLDSYRWIEAKFHFETFGSLPSRCSGVIGLVPEVGLGHGQARWKIWLLCTILERPQGFPDVDELEPDSSAAFCNPPQTGGVGPGVSRANGQVSCLNGSQAAGTFDCIVVGGGIGGLCMAGRLKSLGLFYILVEKKRSIGDTWRFDRYETIKLHTSREYNQMPGLPRTFRSSDPYHLGAEDIASGFRRYVDTFGINVMTSTELVSASYDTNAGLWTLQLRSHGDSLILRSRHIVLAVGSMGVKPNMPALLHRERFKGDVLHGIEWRNATQWPKKDKAGVIVGSGNTAQGIMQEMVNAGFKNVSMIQRSHTFLLPIMTFKALVDHVFNEETPTEQSDRMLLSYPLPIQRLLAMEGIKAMAETHPEYFERIEKRGFKAIRNGDLWGSMYDREGGHFFDLGPGELIANGSVKVISHAAPVAYTETGLQMSDGSQVDADVVVFATGYTSNIREAAKRIFGGEVGSSLEEFWQCDAEGESRGAWKYVGHPRLWYTGHGFAHARYYSRFVAMHIKADVDGRPIEMYTETPEIT